VQRAADISLISCRPPCGLDTSFGLDLGFRSQSLAPPQALCLRLLRRLKSHLFKKEDLQKCC